jgi:hypothetical protein
VKSPQEKRRKLSAWTPARPSRSHIQFYKGSARQCVHALFKNEVAVITFQYDDVEDHEPDELPKPRRGLSLIIVVLLAMTGSGSAFVWRAYGTSGVPVFPSFTSTSAPSAVAATEDKALGLKDFQAFAQQSAAQMQAATQLLGSQQAEIKRLSEQMAALAVKLAAIQQAVASLQPVAPAAGTIPIVPPARKKPTIPKPAEASPSGAPPAPPLQLNR